MGGLPAELLLGHRAGRGLIDAEDAAEEPEALCRDGLDGQVELAADRLGDGSHRVPFVGDRVDHGASCGLFEDEPEETGGVEAVHGWPALGSVTDITGDPGAPGGVDEHRGEPVRPALGVDRAGEADDRGADALLG